MYDRVTDRDFCGCVMGTFASTAVDEHGHRFTKEVLEDWKETIEQNPERRVLNLNHDTGSPIGEILDVKLIQDDDGKHLLHGRYGIFEGQEDVLEAIDSGELQGLSVTATKLVNTTEEEWKGIEPNITVSTLGEEAESVAEIFQEREAKFRLELQKSIEGLAILSAAAGSITIARTVWDLWNWYQELDEEEQANTEVTIYIESQYNFNELDEGDIEDLVEELEE